MSSKTRLVQHYYGEVHSSKTHTQAHLDLIFEGKTGDGYYKPGPRYHAEQHRLCLKRQESAIMSVDGFIVVIFARRLGRNQLKRLARRFKLSNRNKI